LVNTDLARWQFATTSIYHFLFVPISIGLAFLVALLQTAWYRNGKNDYRRLARFFGSLLIINVAVGVVTGIVQEFEFGMNWSAWARYVGNVFGGPLAMEGLAAFFLESTFLGIWIFGWDRLPKRLHLACIWLVSAGSILSAAFILAANSWMQHPVGYKMVHGQPELNNIWALFTNPVFLWGFLHVVLASLVTGALVMLAVSAWHMRRKREGDVFRHTANVSLVVLLPAIILTMFVGSQLGVIEAQYQPMKIAAAEAQWNTCQPCSFSAFQIGGGNNDQTPSQIILIPHLLSLLATNTWNGKVIGLNELQSQYVKKYGPGYYVPNVFIQYWSMRVMAYLASLIFLMALWGILLVRRRALDRSAWWATWFLRIAPWAFLAAFAMNTAGWLLTESGRQPWIVQGLMKTTNGVSPSVSTTEIWISLIGFLAIYVILATVDAFLMVRYGRRSLERAASDGGPDKEDTDVASLSY
jgi:cytochrome bd-type quinol oxidase subunit 1